MKNVINKIFDGLLGLSVTYLTIEGIKKGKDYLEMRKISKTKFYKTWYKQLISYMGAVDRYQAIKDVVCKDCLEKESVFLNTLKNDIDEKWNALIEVCKGKEDFICLCEDIRAALEKRVLKNVLVIWTTKQHILNDLSKNKNYNNEVKLFLKALIHDKRY